MWMKWLCTPLAAVLFCRFVKNKVLFSWVLLWVRTKPMYLNACLSFSLCLLYMSLKQRCLWAPHLDAQTSSKSTISQGAGNRLDFYLKIQQQLFTSWKPLLHLFFTNYLITWEKIIYEVLYNHVKTVFRTFLVLMSLCGCIHTKMLSHSIVVVLL